MQGKRKSVDVASTESSPRGGAQGEGTHKGCPYAWITWRRERSLSRFFALGN